MIQFGSHLTGSILQPRTAAMKSLPIPRLILVGALLFMRQSGSSAQEPGLPTVQFAGVGQYFVNRDSGSFTLAITLSTPSADAVTVQWSTANGSATSPQDYSAGSDTAVFPPGTTRLEIQIAIAN